MGSKRKTKRENGRKNDDGKLRFDLIPVRPLCAIAEVFTTGAQIYDDRNWENGLRWGRVFAAMMRHAFAWWGGERYDPDGGQDHLSSVAWCAMALMEYQETHPDLDDRPKRKAEKGRERQKKVDRRQAGTPQTKA